MKQIEEVYNRLESNKRQLREYKKSIKDELAQNARYAEAQEQIKELKAEMKTIENDTVSSHDREAMDDLKVEISTDKELLADIALNGYVEGETVEVVDEYDQRRVPVFSVNFRKE